MRRFLISDLTNFSPVNLALPSRTDRLHNNDQEATSLLAAMAAALSIVRTSNRKRTQVSYLVDEYYDTLDFELSKQDVEKDASVQSPKTESRDSSEQDGSVFPIVCHSNLYPYLTTCLHSSRKKASRSGRR